MEQIWGESLLTGSLALYISGVLGGRREPEATELLRVHLPELGQGQPVEGSKWKRRR